MSDPGSAIDSAVGSLLSEEQVRICQDLSSQEKGIVSQRAVALLNLNGGSTQAKAATISGLTIGQVRYLMYAFRRKGIMFFPSGKDHAAEEKISSIDSKPDVSETVSEGTTILTPTATDSQSQVEKKKKTGSKKDKGKDKDSKKKTLKKKIKKNAKKKKSKKNKKNKKK